MREVRRVIVLEERTNRRRPFQREHHLDLLRQLPGLLGVGEELFAVEELSSQVIHDGLVIFAGGHSGLCLSSRQGF